MNKHIQISIPFEHLVKKYLPLVLENHINPEIVINHLALDNFLLKDFHAVAKQVLAAGLSVTIHAPFLDLRPGALDPKIRQVSFARLEDCFAVGMLFQPKAFICHHAFDAKYYISKDDEWLDNSIRFWSALLTELPHQVYVALENVYETDPTMLKKLLEEINSPQLRFCFDTGHCNCFSAGRYQEWVAELGAFLTNLHMHDNTGKSDEHLPLLEGDFPFNDFFSLLKQKGIKAMLTIEAHSTARLIRSLENLEKLDYRAVL